MGERIEILRLGQVINVDLELGKGKKEFRREEKRRGSHSIMFYTHYNCH